MVLTHEDRRDRRRQMAMRVRQHEDPAEVAAAEGVSIDLVRRACIEHNVPCYTVPPDRLVGKTIAILRALRDTKPDKTLQEIATRLKVSIQRVKQVQAEGVEHGFLKRRRKILKKR